MLNSRFAKLRMLDRWLVALLLSGALLMSGTLAFAAVPATGAMVSAAGAPIVPLVTPNVTSVGNQMQELESENWSGYVLTSLLTNRQYVSVSAQWVVPTVSLAPKSKRMYSGTWIGIGGFCANLKCTKSDSSLIQVGTEQDVTRAGATYDAWYEMLPAAETEITSLRVHPGDVISASLRGIPLGGTSRDGKLTDQQVVWLLSLDNISTGQSWTKVVEYQSSLASVEWIQEAPTVGNKIGALANYSMATFDPTTADGSNPDLGSAVSIIMVNPHGQTSNPSNPNPSQDGFNTCWGNNGNVTPCPAPTN